MFTNFDKRALRSQLVDAGAFDHATTASWVKFLATLSAFAALTIATVLLPWWCAFFLVPLAAVPAVTAAMIGHEGGHGSFSSSKRQNELILHLAFPLFTGLGALHWKQKHNHLHHSHPNVMGKDGDINVWPMALSSVAHESSGRLRRWLQRSVQGYLFWPLTLFLGFTMRYDSIKHLVARARERGVDGAWLADVGCMVGHYLLWLVVPALWFGVVPVLLFYLALWGIAGCLLALVFAPAHMGMPIVDSQGERWLHQLQTTRDLTMPRWLSWLFVGLDYQVEHHLFPKIPHQRMASASRIVRSWCADHDAPYRRIGYAASVADVTRHMFVSWKDAPVDLAAAQAAPTTPAALG